MEIKYKPTKQKKQKPAKAPRMPNADKPMRFGSAQTVKIDKPKKVKEPKIKAPKQEKPIAFKPGKLEKVMDMKASGKLSQPVRPAIVAAVFSAVVIIAVIVVVAVFFGGRGDTDAPIVKPVSMAISSPPENVVYYVGDEPTWYGLKVDVTLSNGMVVSLKGTDCEITGFDSSAPAENQKVTLNYQGCTASFTVTILGNGNGGGNTEKAELSFKTLPKTEYKVGEYKSVEGGVLLLRYENGKTEEITLNYEHLYDFTTKAPGAYTVNVKLLKNGKLYTTSYTITVTE